MSNAAHLATFYQTHWHKAEQRVLELETALEDALEMASECISSDEYARFDRLWTVLEGDRR